MAVRAATASAVAIPSGNIIGVTDGSNAPAGVVGEFLENIVTNAAPVNLTNAVSTNLVSLLLPAGDWDVEAMASFATSIGLQVFSAAQSVVSAAFPVIERTSQNNLASNGRCSIALPRQRYTIAAPGTVFIIVQASFSSGTCTAYGWINARRVR